MVNPRANLRPSAEEMLTDAFLQTPDVKMRRLETTIISQDAKILAQAEEIRQLKLLLAKK